MTSKSKAFLWIALAIAIVFGVLWQFYSLPNASNRMKELPLQGSEYIGKDVPLNSFEENFFKNVNVIKRVYKVDGQNLFISVLDGTNNRHLVHDPYYCFRGGGWNILSEKPFPIPGGQASLVDIEKEGESKKALFWFSDGSRNYSSPMRYWWETTLRRLTLGRSGPEPVLVLVQPLTDEEVDWEKLPISFPKLFHL